MSDYITAAEATTILRDLARGREDGNGGDVWPLYDRAEDAMRQVIALDLAATLLESERAAERTRAEAAEAEVARLTTERDAARAEAAGLRVIVDAVDELAFCDYAAEVESYSETAPGSHAAAQARAADAYGALVRMRDAWRETHGAIATPPTVAAESATVAPKGKR